MAKDNKAAKNLKASAKPELDENAMAGAQVRKWADWVEPDFPFFSSVLDARSIGEGFPKPCVLLTESTTCDKGVLLRFNVPLDKTTATNPDNFNFGPSWKGLYDSERLLSKGGDKATANDAYLKESIINPSAKVVQGYEKLDAGMPIYSGVLNDSQIESLILFIRSLK
ncbi:MAG: hypothetical protein WCN98_20910 [Verrucomicrobiaceae bacterium]